MSKQNADGMIYRLFGANWKRWVFAIVTLPIWVPLVALCYLGIAAEWLTDEIQDRAPKLIWRRR